MLFSELCIVILDNIELIFPRDDSNFSLVYALQSWIQELKDQENLSLNSATTNTSRHRVVVLGLTQDARALDPSVAIMFDDSIELDIPTPEERSVILQASAVNHQMTGQQDFASELEAVSQKCHGYLPADLDALCTQAAIIAHGHGRRLNNCSKQDFYDGMKAIRVSALRQNTSVQKVDPVYWSDIGGLENVKVQPRFLVISLLSPPFRPSPVSNRLFIICCPERIENFGGVCNLAVQAR